MKKIIIPYLVMVLLLATVVPVLAKGGGRVTLVLIGTIDAIKDSTIEVNVIRSSKLARSYIGYSVTIITTQETIFLEKLDDGTTQEIEFSDLTEGNFVSVSVIRLEDQLTARRVTRGADLLHLP